MGNNIKLCSLSNRFRDIIFKNYVNKICQEEEKQFSAMCFQIDKKTTCIAFRGTDDNLVGWKEDFNMSFNTPIPAQNEAVDYLNTYGIKAKKETCGEYFHHRLSKKCAANTRQMRSKLTKLYGFSQRFDLMQKGCKNKKNPRKSGVFR